MLTFNFNRSKFIIQRRKKYGSIFYTNLILDSKSYYAEQIIVIIEQSTIQLPFQHLTFKKSFGYFMNSSKHISSLFLQFANLVFSNTNLIESYDILQSNIIENFLHKLQFDNNFNFLEKIKE